MKLTLILLLLSSTSFAANCEFFKGREMSEKLCWDNSLKGWVSARCLTDKCEAKNKIKAPSPAENLQGQNPAAIFCHDLKQSVVILRDSQNNEQSFCLFKDKSLIDSNALMRNVK